jgi:5'-nucleotidase
LPLAATVASGVVGAPAVAHAAGPVPVQVLAINDFHGRISLTTGGESRLTTGPGSDGVYGPDESGESDDAVARVGGAMNLASTIWNLQAEYREAAGGSAASFLVAAGDIVGASPPESAEFKDEPAIEVANALGVDVASVGDDEFSRGTAELRRISAATDGQYTDDVTACQGITPGVDGCFGEEAHAFTGADFPYLAANVISRRTGEPMLPPYQILFTPSGVRLGLIGAVTQETETRVPPEGITDVDFLDEANAVNRWVPELQRQGVEAIGVIIHEGAEQFGPNARDPNGCDQLEGSLLDTNNRIDPAVDLIVSGFTHDAFNCMLPVPDGAPRLVTHAGAYGRLVTDIRLTLDPRTGDVDRAATYSAVNHPVTRGDPEESVQAIVDYWIAGPGGQPADGAPGSEAVTAAAAAASASENRARTLAAVAILASIVLLAGAWLKFGGAIRKRFHH